MNTVHTSWLLLSITKQSCSPVLRHPLMNSFLKYSPRIEDSFRKTRRGTKAGRNFFRPIQTIVTTNRTQKRENTQTFQSTRNLTYLTESIDTADKYNGNAYGLLIPTIVTSRTCQIENKGRKSSITTLSMIPKAFNENILDKLSMISLNARSVNNKSTSVCDLIVSNNVDLLALTETWLGTKTDKAVISEIKPDSYEILQVPRKDKRGGGVALIYKDAIDIKRSKPILSYTHFELLECNVTVQSIRFRLCIVYRPPPSKENKLKNSVFFEEWSDYLNRLTVIQEEIVITGDMNFHLDENEDSDTRKFVDTLYDHGLEQHIVDPTHKLGHTLDVVITRENSTIMKETPLVQDAFLFDRKGNLSGDHLALFTSFEIKKPPKERKTVSYRKLRDINTDAFSADLSRTEIGTSNTNDMISLDDLVNLYDSDIKSIVDKHAPLKTKNLILRPNTDWYTDDLRASKRERRKAERRMRKTKLTIHRQMFKEACKTTNKLILQCKKDYFSNKIAEIGHDQKQLHRLTGDLMGNQRIVHLPESENEKDLADKFCEFFVGKISLIRDKLASNNASLVESNYMRADVAFEGNKLKSFQICSTEEIRKIILSSPSKSCELDPLPTTLLKCCLESILPVIARIVNKSLSESYFPPAFKRAVVRPLLKKTDLDKEVLKNYRPVSNLTFISKILEKVVSVRIENHINSHSLHDPAQSAYRSSHSTETALLRVHHDIASALDNNYCAVLIMLDLSAAFDTIDHSILLNRLEFSYGITGDALNWLESYLTDRKQCVSIGTVQSDDIHLRFGVPQGSVLGPKLFCMFSKPVSEICKQHGMSYHSYADDTQVYQVIQPLNDWTDLSERLEKCLSDISAWMSLNMLKINQDKTELIVFAPKHKVSSMSNFQLSFDGTIVTDVSFVKNLGCIFDKTLSMEDQASAITRSCFYQIRNIGRIRSLITDDACKTLICSLVTSRLDYANALLYGTNSSVMAKLQRVQNTAARLVTRTKKHDSITPVLMSLHWLPVQYRCEYKLLLYVFKALHGNAPVYLQELIKLYRPARTLRSENSRLLCVPTNSRTKRYGDRRFDKAGSYLWNNLPSSLRNEQSINVFKKNLKTHLFKKAFL